jgi:hypothetical protein
MDCEKLINELQDRIKSLELDVQYNLHLLEEKTKELQSLKDKYEKADREG